MFEVITSLAAIVAIALALWVFSPLKKWKPREDELKTHLGIGAPWNRR